MQKIKLSCRTIVPGMPYEAQADQCAAGGADAVQFSAPDLSAKELLAVGQRMKDRCAQQKILFFMCGRPDLALALNADGIHLEDDDIPALWARQVLGPRKIIGATISSLGRATQAVQDGVDYLAVGPLYPAGSAAGKPLAGIDLIRLVKKRVKVPVLALGGITYETVAEVVAAGADGVIAEQAVCGAQDVTAAAQAMKNRVVQCETERKAETEHDTY